MVLDLPGVQEVGYGATWYGHPVNMKSIRWADNTMLSRLVEGMQLASGDADIEPAGQPGLVGCLAGGAEIVQVFLLVLHTLQDSHLLGRVVEVVDGGRAGRAGLLIGTDVALIPGPGVRHRAALVGGGRLAVQWPEGERDRDHSAGSRSIRLLQT